MVNCPKCGTDVASPLKTWPIPSRKPLDEGERPKLTGIFDCPRCKAKFRAAVEVETKIVVIAGARNVVEGAAGIKGELVQTLVNLRQKISELESERASLLVEIGKLKKAARSRMNALESEVGMLRDEAKSLRDLLGYEEKGKWQNFG